jgi:hypothetical protein
LDIGKPWISSARLPEEVDGLVDMAEKEMAATESPIGNMNVRAVGIEADRFLDQRDRGL